MDRIRLLCNITIVALVPMSLYYIYSSGGWALNEALLQPERWLSDSWVQPGAVIAPLTRWVFFFMWILPVALGVFGYVIAVRLALLVRSGVLFDEQVARFVFWMGFGVASSSAAKVFAACLSPMVKSWHNLEGPLPLRFWYSSEEIGLIFCGLGFVIFGLILHEAIKIARENEGFV